MSTPTRFARNFASGEERKKIQTSPARIATYASRRSLNAVAAASSGSIHIGPLHPRRVGSEMSRAMMISIAVGQSTASLWIVTYSGGGSTPRTTVHQT